VDIKALKLKVKVSILLFLSKLANPCRMYDEKPAEATEMCFLCAHRDGWLRCNTSRKIKREITTNRKVISLYGEKTSRVAGLLNSTEVKNV
jgi:hypothetical protein